MDPSSISDAEWEIMEVVWAKSPITAQNVIATLQPKTGWAPTTVRTLLARLVKKKCLDYAESGNRFLYRAKVKRDVCLKHASESFLARFFGGESVPMALHLVRSGRLSREDLDELRRLLDEEEARDE
jgi:BlaI family penicillinase repressor